jgi:N-acetylglucosamine-6-phosphate deacetylase
MTGLHHRAPGTLGAVMVSPQVRCELIADNVHVHPGAMKLLWRVKGEGGVILITDSVRAAGMPDGVYHIDDRVFQVVEGVARLQDGTLAGSTLTLNRGLLNFMQAVGEPLERVWPVSSLNAARDLHVDDRKGSLEVGKDADLVLVDDGIGIHMTVVGGRVVYRQPQRDLV